jgi:hypothetical protein
MFRCDQNGPPARREQRSRRPIFIATPWAWPVGCFSALLAPYVSIQDTLVARALKNSQLIYG